MSRPTPTAKEAALLNLFDEWRNCTRCPLGHPQDGWHRTQVVLGDGNPNADIVVIGIAPGHEEDQEGMPFIGESGHVLDDLIQKVGLIRENLWTMNIVQCRAISMGKDHRGKPKIENRNPSGLERAACRPFWERMLYLIDPLIVVAMGQPVCQEVASTGSEAMHDLNNNLRQVTVRGSCVPVSYPVMNMYHPAYLSRTGDMYRGGPWHRVLVAWRRTVYYVDRMRAMYFNEPMPERPFSEKDLFYRKGEI